MKTAVHGDFSNGSMRKLILYQAIPLTLAQLVQLLYNIVDRVYIGHMPGTDAGIALTGLGLCFPIITMISGFVNLIGTGSAPLCSMARGKRDLDTAKNILITAYTLMIFVSIGVALIVYLFMNPLLYLLGASATTIGYATDYLRIYLLGTLFFAMGTGMNGFINLQGYPKMGMVTTMLGAVVNLLLDPLFIFVFHMGVKGAALATVISQFFSAAWVIRFLSREQMELRLDPKKLAIHTDLTGQMLLLGMPGFIVAFTNSAVQSVCNATLSVYGGDAYIGIMTIINSVREIISLPVHGISNGSQPVLSYNYGAKSYSRVRTGIRFAFLMALVYTTIFWIATLLIPRLFLRIFCTDAAMIELGLKPLMVYFMGFIFMTFQFSAQSTFVALGKAKHSIFFSIFRKIVIVVPLTLLLPKIPGMGVMGVFWAEPISNLIGGVAAFSTMYLTVYRPLGKLTDGK